MFYFLAIRYSSGLNSGAKYRGKNQRTCLFFIHLFISMHLISQTAFRSKTNTSTGTHNQDKKLLWHKTTTLTHMQYQPFLHKTFFIHHLKSYSTVANDIQKYFIFFKFQENKDLPFKKGTSTWQTIHMKCQIIFSENLKRRILGYHII